MKNLFALLLCALALIGCGGGGQSHGPVPTYAISGKATNGEPRAKAMSARSTKLAAGSAIANANVDLIDKTGANGPFSTTTDANGNWEIAEVPEGVYDLEVRGIVEGTTVWNVLQGITVQDNTNLGSIPLTANPLLRSVTILRNGATDTVIEEVTNRVVHLLTPSVGDVITVAVEVEDPNQRPMTMTASAGTNVEGLTLTYTVTSADVAAGRDLVLDINNDDGVGGGLDGVRDLLVIVKLVPSQQSNDTISDVQINGTPFDPTTTKISTSEPFTISASSNAPVTFAWDQGGASFVTSDNPAQISAEVTNGLYQVDVLIGAGTARQRVTLQVDTPDQPAAITSMELTNALKDVYVPGDQINVEVTATDPNGGTLEYLFDYQGANGPTPPAVWQTSNVSSYVVTGQESASFKVVVFVRNSDGRVYPMFGADARRELRITVGQ